MRIKSIMTTTIIMFMFVTCVKLKQSNDVSETRSNDGIGYLIPHSVHIRSIHKLVDRTRTYKTIESTGSGVVVGVNLVDKTSIILTAHHICKSDYQAGIVINNMLVLESKTFVFTANNDALDVTGVLYEDKQNDICVIEVAGIAGKTASYATSYPKQGERIQTVGAPIGKWDAGVNHMSEGFYVGKLKKLFMNRFSNFIQYSLPVIGGMSGSGVFYKGKIIGIISHNSNQYSNIGWGPGVVQVKKAIITAEDIWRND